jgi:hypothetical protein
MKKVSIAILMLMPALSWAAKPTPNPADYPVTVHVQSSQLSYTCHGVSSDCGSVQHLTVIIDGKKYDLDSDFEFHLLQLHVLRLGDYKARIYSDTSKYPHFGKLETPNVYEYSRTYEFLFPDGQTREYFVVGESE